MPAPADGLDPDVPALASMADAIMAMRGQLERQQETITGLCAIVKAQAKTNTMLVTLAGHLLSQDDA